MTVREIHDALEAATETWQARSVQERSYRIGYIAGLHALADKLGRDTIVPEHAKEGATR